MSDLPAVIANSLLWRRISTEASLVQAIINLRETAEAIGSQITRLLPDFTDHTVNHMDALWRVASSVLTAKEIEKLTPSEAFVLSCTFYLHDLAMGYCATADGLDKLSKTAEYRAAYDLAATKLGLEATKAEAFAVKEASRQLHAYKAKELAINVLPGLDRHLLEPTSIRNHWAEMIGEVAESHHWPLSVVADRLGKQNKVPDPIGGEYDLGYVACLLRIIDYAHINFERAPVVERALRVEIDPSSIIHWQAQENITGPSRDDNRLVFGCMKPIDNVDAWWLFYEMAQGLDSEIRAVRDYLGLRSCSKDRFSLEGVKGTSSPSEFSTFVRTYGFEPIDLRFKPDSMDRLVAILGGKSLYGNDVFAPIRELLQNSVDAITLQESADNLAGIIGDKHQINVTLDELGSVRVADTGVGMTPHKISNFLLGIASDYWNSHDFLKEYSGVRERGFRQAGKFGIGFLSVFMLGDDIEVETQTRGGKRYLLKLNGVGRRGALIAIPPHARSGTEVRVKVTKQSAGLYGDLASVIKSRVPMISIPIDIRIKEIHETVEPGWWRTLMQEDFIQFINRWRFTARGRPIPRSRHDYIHERQLHGAHVDKWPNTQPEINSDSYRVLAMPGYGCLLICSKGVAVETVPSKGLIGLINIDELDLTANRNTPVGFDMDQLTDALLGKLDSKIVQSLNELDRASSIPSLHGFISKVARYYGHTTLRRSSLRWITLVEPPGSAILVSSNELAARLAQMDSVTVGYGVGPWSIAKTAQTMIDGLPNGTVFIPISAKDEARFGHYRDEGIIGGNLEEHFSRAESELSDAALLISTLDCIASSWSTTLEDLTKANWLRKENDYIVARLSRS